jgi:DNA-binding NtrC family response regulator
MVSLILSRDADFATEMQALLEGRGRAVHVATSRREAERIRAEADVEMVVWDPVMEVG